MDVSLFYLELSNQPIKFDPVSNLTNVFFDDSNRQVCFLFQVENT